MGIDGDRRQAVNYNGTAGVVDRVDAFKFHEGVAPSNNTPTDPTYGGVKDECRITGGRMALSLCCELRRGDKEAPQLRQTVTPATVAVHRICR